jgi:hypothetical protein
MTVWYRNQRKPSRHLLPSPLRGLLISITCVNSDRTNSIFGKESINPHERKHSRFWTTMMLGHLAAMRISVVSHGLTEYERRQKEPQRFWWKRSHGLLCSVTRARTFRERHKRGMPSILKS